MTVSVNMPMRQLVWSVNLSHNKSDDFLFNSFTENNKQKPNLGSFPMVIGEMFEESGGKQCFLQIAGEGGPKNTEEKGKEGKGKKERMGGRELDPSHGLLFRRDDMSNREGNPYMLQRNYWCSGNGA